MHHNPNFPLFEDPPSDDELAQEDSETEDVSDEYEPQYEGGFVGYEDFDEDDADNAL